LSAARIISHSSWLRTPAVTSAIEEEEEEEEEERGEGTRRRMLQAAVSGTAGLGAAGPTEIVERASGRFGGRDTRRRLVSPLPSTLLSKIHGVPGSGARAPMSQYRGVAAPASFVTSS
jgi:hypothetical protein